MKKIVLNRCYGGFGLSNKAIQLFLEKADGRIFAYMDSIDLEWLRFNPEENPHYVWFAYQDLGETPIKFEGRHELASGLDRDDPALVATVEELGDAANDWASKLEIVEIPDDVDWEIEECDGREWVRERSRSW